MLSLARTSTRQATHPLVRSLATKALPLSHPDAGPSKALQEEDKQHYAQLSTRKVPVNPRHGLYGFFRQTKALKGHPREYEVVETPDSGQLATGRSWEASELRNKSFKDLHTLWYVALRERNLLATQKEEARRMGVMNVDLQVPMDKVRAVGKTMSRIKYVLNERRLAYEGAVKLAEKQVYSFIERTAPKKPIDEEDRKILYFQRGRKARAAPPNPQIAGPVINNNAITQGNAKNEETSATIATTKVQRKEPTLSPEGFLIGRRRGQPKPNKKTPSLRSTKSTKGGMDVTTLK